MTTTTTKTSKTPAAETHGFDRRLPTAFFLAEVVLDLPVYGWVVGAHCYVSRTESGLYRVLRHGRAWLVSEGVAARHLHRVRGSDGAPVRVAGQQRRHDTWNESYSEARRTARA